MSAKKGKQSGSQHVGKPKPTKAKTPAPPAKSDGKANAANSSKSNGNRRELSDEKKKDNERVITENRKSRFEYFVLEHLECGIVLQGSEVKSLRAGHVSIDESYGRVRDGEVWLINCEIREYLQANRHNHVPKRPRKLLMHRREVMKFASRADDRGLTLVPLKMYFKEGRCKVLLGLCKGKQLHDKRQTMKKADAKRDIQRAMRGKLK
jgi:SsrA-binding protein